MSFFYQKYKKKIIAISLFVNSITLKAKLFMLLKKAKIVV